LPENAIWIDMVDPTREEEANIERLLGLEVPTREDMKDIEPSSRLYIENGSVFLTASLLWRADTNLPMLTDVAFILTGKSAGDDPLRRAPKSFALFKAAMQRITARTAPRASRSWRKPARNRRRPYRGGPRIRQSPGPTRCRCDVFGDRRHLTKIRQPANYLEDRLKDAVSALSPYWSAKVPATA
jgi:magnesium transporter